ncbi:MAG: hypothetical protein HY650_12295 [Acidobacteria bacterium]|nr:hypothetical protein [Acidobacteriota bacterium]
MARLGEFTSALQSAVAPPLADCRRTPSGVGKTMILVVALIDLVTAALFAVVLWSRRPAGAS